MDLYGLKLSIERKKVELSKLISNTKLTDDRVVSCSEELDKLIVQYQKLISPCRLPA